MTCESGCSCNVINDNHSNSEYPSRGCRKIRGAAFDVSPENQEAILNFKYAEYVCLAKEICPSTGREHIQFYMYCKNAVRLSTLRTAIKDAGFQKCDASHGANIMYVLKQRDKDYNDHPEIEDYDGNAATFRERGTRPDEEAAAARTLESLTECQNFFLATQEHQPDWLRAKWFGKISDVTDNLCHLMDLADFGSDSDGNESDVDMLEQPSKKIKY